MTPRLALPLAVVLLTACAVPTRTTGSERGIPAAGRAQALAPRSLTGIVMAPAGIIAAGAGNVIAAGAGNYRTLGLVENPLADAEVYLADAAGEELPGVPRSKTDAQGRFEFPGVSADLVCQVMVRASQNGKPARLRAIAQADGNTPVSVSAATTLVTVMVLKGASGMGGFDRKAYDQAVQATQAAFVPEKPPDLGDETVDESAETAAAEVPAIKESLEAVKVALAASPTPAPAAPATPASTAPSVAPAAASTPAPKSLSRFDIIADRLPKGRYGGVLATGASASFVLGGYDGSFITGVARAPGGPGGALGGFVYSGLNLLEGRQGHVALLTKQGLFVFGGHNGTSILANAEAARFDADGKLAEFKHRPYGLTTRRYEAASARAGNFFYVLGGTRDTTSDAGQLATIERAVVGPEGAVGEFNPIDRAPLYKARQAAYAFATDKFLYVVGGWNGKQSLAAVDVAPIDANGNVTKAFEPTGNGGLVQPRSVFAAGVLGNHLYVAGGTYFNGKDHVALDSVERAPIRADGTLGRFELLGVKLNRNRSGATGLVSGDAFYVIGGRSLAAGIMDTIERAVLR